MFSVSVCLCVLSMISCECCTDCVCLRCCVFICVFFVKNMLVWLVRHLLCDDVWFVFVCVFV